MVVGCALACLAGPGCDSYSEARAGLSPAEEARFDHGVYVRCTDGAYVCSAQFSPDGRKLATASGGLDKTARVFDLSTKTEEARFEHGDDASHHL